MTLLGHWKFAGQPQTNLVADQSGTMDITHGGGGGAGWWRDSPDYALAGDNSSWAFTPDLANRPDPTSHTDLSFCFAIKALPNPRTATSIFSFYGSSAGGNKGWGLALNMSLGSIQCIDSAALWNGTSWQTFPNTGNVFPSVADQRTNYYGFVINMTQGGNAEAFIDGQSLGTVTTGTFQHDTTAGTQTWGRDYSYIDNIQYHDRLLTASEIQAQANSPRTWVEATGLGDEQLWISATNDNTGTSTAFNDQSGQGNNGTATGTLVVADTSEGGTYAFDFTASSQNVIKTGFDFGGKTNFSWSAWIYDDRRSNPSNAHNAYFSFSGRGTAQYSQDIYFFSVQGEKRFQVNSGVDGSNHYPDGLQVWTHMAVIYDGTEAVASDRVKYYENGVQVTPTSTFNYPTSVPTNTASPDTQIGGYAMTANSTHWFTGKQDDIRVFDRTLTQAEITHLSSERGIEGPPPVGLGDEQLWLCPSLSGENTNDLSGNGNLTAVQGNISYTANSGEGGSLCFEGDGSTGSNGLKLDSPSSADLPASATYTMWVQAHDLSGTRYFIAGRSTSNANMFDLAIKSPNLRCRINNGGTTLFQPSGLLTVNTWHHVSLTRSTDSWELFIDGVSSATGSGTLSSYTQDFTTWMQNTVGSSTLDGYMDDIRVYNRVLAQSEITHLATSRGIEGGPTFTGLGDEQLWLCPSLDDSADDISGYGRNGTYQGGMGTIANTGSGGSRAYEINNLSKYIDCGNILDAPSEFTLSLWFYRTTNDRGGLVSKWSGSGGYMIFNGEIPTAASNGSPYAAGNSPSLNTWQHIAATYDGTDLKIYQDGVETASIADTAPLSTSDNFMIGKYGLVVNRSQYDDIRAYTRAITQAEITHLASQRGVEGPPPVGLGDEQLWLCPSLNDSANDISGSGNDGTYQGGMGTIADTSNGGSFAYDFDGVNDYIKGSTLGSGTTDAICVAMWLNLDVWGAGKYLFSLNGSGSSAANNSLDAYITQTNILYAFTRPNPSVTQYTYSSGAGNWFHLCFNREAGTGTVDYYINGVKVESATGNSDLASLANGYVLGGYAGGQNQFNIDGKVDDFRVFERSLTQAEITHLATSRGIEGSPSTTTQYNAFITHAFKQLFQTRLR